MRTTRAHFEEVSLRAERTVIDENGKKRKQKKKFYQTINPFNKRANGSVKDRDFIMLELREQAQQWTREAQP
ncbi:MAG: hypothetical protein Q8L60_10885 [Gammaproteobacteria bacterium]|nr:hypothetical protein [Gammaproteobacteria bacterium]MDP2346852.1 hypothetical protein [Gammaproteobacteria bacterium]